ncbi:MAG: PSD1 domain-containing protein [Bryobacterales bacterium]|nr:PSD1 domain-containing protein [Bryobacterales bacterium]
MGRVVLLLLCVNMATGASAADARAILEKNCFGCHGSAAMAGLDLRSREAMLKGGARGAAVKPGVAAESLLYRVVSGAGPVKMPPGKQTLAGADVQALRAWIDAGAAWSDAKNTNVQPAWWAFRAPVRPALKTAAGNPIDAFLPATSGAAASRRTLIRRLAFDLHGLPPKPEEVEAFERDPDPAAYEKLIDRLLDSPHYGERAARQWLDVVRYADTGGYETDVYFPSAWRYRDYVIRSFQRDKPYDVFVKEQIAADEIWPDNLDLDGAYEIPQARLESLERRLGTALFTLGALPVENSFFGDQYRSEWQAEAVETVGSAFLGLTLGCARCHDHKFDPISQRDFYRLSAVFAGSEDREVPITSPMRIFEFTRYQTRWVALEELRRKFEHLKPGDKDGRETLLRQMGEAYAKTPKFYDKANLLAHTEPVHDTHVLARGDFKQKGEKVGPGFPAALGVAAPEIREPADTNYFIPRRRKALAEWLAAPEHPLTARVMVNRIWQGHFGRGLVGTPNDFGRQGEAPLSQELLDWLAVEFREKNWSVKHLHRVILRSRYYQQQRTPLRLDAESLRDAVLAANGALNAKQFGPAVVPPLTREERDGGMRDASQWPVSLDAAEHDRRSIYLFVKRSYRLPMMESFDAPDPAASCARRETSTVAPQALTLMNSEWMHAQAARLATRVEKDADPVVSAWRRALGRAPLPAEHARAKTYAARAGLSSLCLLLFNMNEFIYVD